MRPQRVASGAALHKSRPPYSLFVLCAYLHSIVRMPLNDKPEHIVGTGIIHNTYKQRLCSSSSCFAPNTSLIRPVTERPNAESARSQVWYQSFVHCDFERTKEYV